jgi:hypothetical protein
MYIVTSKPKRKSSNVGFVQFIDDSSSDVAASNAKIIKALPSASRD